MKSITEKRHLKHLHNLTVIARDIEPVKSARIAASIVHKNQIISIGINSYKSNPLQKRFGKNSFAIFMHAEISAINNALRILKDKQALENTTLYIARMKKTDYGNNEWLWAYTRPCMGCQKAIDYFRIKRVIYTTDREGNFEIL